MLILSTLLLAVPFSSVAHEGLLEETSSSIARAINSTPQLQPDETQYQSSSHLYPGCLLTHECDAQMDRADCCGGMVVLVEDDWRDLSLAIFNAPYHYKRPPFSLPLLPREIRPPIVA